MFLAFRLFKPLYFFVWFDGTIMVLLLPCLFNDHVCMYGHTYSKSMYQPGEVASPGRDQLKLNRKMNISLSAFVRA